MAEKPIQYDVREIPSEKIASNNPSRHARPLVPDMQTDINESYIRQCDEELLRILLTDRTMTAHNQGAVTNIKWACDDYAKAYPDKDGFGAKDEILPDAISTQNATENLRVVTPRVAKRAEEQRRRSVEKAEVFTPSWVCNEQNNLVDEAWFGRSDRLFNEPNPDFGVSGALNIPVRRWRSLIGRKHLIVFPREKGRQWRDYVKALRLEVSCGEAPYLTSRYDTTDGSWISPNERIGLLDRKLRVITERVGDDCNAWVELAEEALKSCYGFEWQGDNVLLARENMLFAVLEAYECDFRDTRYRTAAPPIPPKVLRRFAEIISWNIWQMDGIKFVVPNSCHPDETRMPRLDGTDDVVKKPCPGCAKHDAHKHNGIRCRVMDWEINKPVLFMPPFDFKPIEESKVR